MALLLALGAASAPCLPAQAPPPPPGPSLERAQSGVGARRVTAAAQAAPVGQERLSKDPLSHERAALAQAGEDRRPSLLRYCALGAGIGAAAGFAYGGTTIAATSAVTTLR